MPLFFSCFAFLLVHSFSITVTTALPVSCQALPQQNREKLERFLMKRIHSVRNQIGPINKKILKEEETEQTVPEIEKKEKETYSGRAQVTPAITQTQGQDSKQIRAPDETLPLKIEGNSLPRHSTPSSRHTEEDGEEKKDDFQPCIVSNKTFQHREQIPRADPCEMCVCVDSEVYCFWKLCILFNSTTFTPTPSTASISKHATTKQSINDNNVYLSRANETETKANEVETTDEKFSKILKDERKYNALKKLEATSPKNSDAKSQIAVTSTTEKPTVCYVMGVMYKYGEVLPRDTGTCLECACSEGGRVSCSPKDCVSQPDLDYLSHNNNLDMFDLDTF